MARRCSTEDSANHRSQLLVHERPELYVLSAAPSARPAHSFSIICAMAAATPQSAPGRRVLFLASVAVPFTWPQVEAWHQADAFTTAPVQEGTEGGVMELGKATA